MGISELHVSHIRDVRVGVVLSSPNLTPQDVTATLGIEPDSSASRGDEQRNIAGKLMKPHTEGYWRIDTKGKVQSKDINDHFRFLLSLLLPHTKSILKFAQDGETYFDVLWQSTYLYAGTGPVIDSECLQGVSELQAGMGFDIYQIDEDE